MRKRWFLAGMVLFLVPGLLGSCGVAQEQYNTVAADLGKSQQEMQSVKAELEAAQARVSELAASLEKAESELESSQAENSELTSGLGKVETELEAAQAELETIQKELEATSNEYTSFKSDLIPLWGSYGKELSVAQVLFSLSGKIAARQDWAYLVPTVEGKLAELNSAELTAMWEETCRPEGGGYRIYTGPLNQLIAMSISRSAEKATALSDKIIK